MKYLIIGLGIYGTNLAIDLTKLGHEVIGADINPSLVEAIKDYISTAYIIDSSDEAALNMLPIKNVDLVIVAIGENFGASIRTVALLRKMGVEHIYARAIDKLHESILDSFNLDRIITPEQRAAEDLVNEIELGTKTSSIRVNSNTFIMKFEAPSFFYGMKYSTLDFPHKYGMSLVAATRAVESKNMLGVSHIDHEMIDIAGDDEHEVQAGDVMVCLGSEKAFRTMFRTITSM